jgi:hypothetical protein
MQFFMTLSNGRGIIKSWQRSQLRRHSLEMVRGTCQHVLHASDMALGAGFLFLYQRVGKRAHEVVNKIL